MGRADDQRHAVRREQHLRRLGVGREPCCALCIEDEPAALTADDDGMVLCYECRAEHTGRAAIEHHHLAGRHNDPSTVAVPGNVHRQLSDAQRDWPIDTLRNPQANPLLRAAAWLRGFLDLLRVMIDALSWLPPYLEERARHETGEHDDPRG
ncbi:hypothetical protein FSW04_13830 [Baekduia soli]|uniref:Uncharacterized protein n=1 Tax=Baekduia soli TaxID=496014 RepID=A0A5B8U6R9_9ACTN|nr:hypothetical protein [Baekduia soli]QEC48538.1 hypothetical protein FSW04_13830 [Baekduia soli]